MQGLVAYVYTHLIMCPRLGWLGWVYNDDWSDRVSELKQLVERWIKYGDIWCILVCDSIKEGLLKVLRAVRGLGSQLSTPLTVLRQRLGLKSTNVTRHC